MVIPLPASGHGPGRKETRKQQGGRDGSQISKTKPSQKFLARVRLTVVG